MTSMANLAATYWKARSLEGEQESRLSVHVDGEPQKDLLEKNIHNTLLSMGNLAATYWNQGYWKKAEQLEVQVMENCKRGPWRGTS